MKAALSSSVILFFPHMNDAFLPPDLPGGVRIMNPGRVADRDERQWLPVDLPYDRRQVQAMIREYLAFGDRFSRSAEMAYFEVRGLEDFYTDSRQAIQSELMGGTSSQGDPMQAALQKAQMVLALGDLLEERMAEMRALENRVSASRENFSRVLGIDTEDVEDGIPVEPASAGAGEETLAWARLLEPFLLFLPENGALLFSDSAIREGLEEKGVRFSVLQDQDAVAGFPDTRVPDGCVLARVRSKDILSPGSASLVGDREFMLIFWNAGA